MPLNVLVTAASRRVPLVQAFQRALRHVVAGRRRDRHRRQPAVAGGATSPTAPTACRSRSTATTSIEIARHLRRRARRPGRADDRRRARALRRRPRSIRRRIGIRVAVSPPATTQLLQRQVRRPAARCATHGIAAAATYLPAASCPATSAFPLFIKPRVGRGGVGAFADPQRARARLLPGLRGRTRSCRSISTARSSRSTCCATSTGACSPIVPRERVVIRAGVIDRGRTVNDPRAHRAGARRAPRAMPFAGAVNIQCRMVDGGPWCSRSTRASRAASRSRSPPAPTFRSMLVELAAGRHVAPAIGRFRDRLWMTSYESSVFLDDGVRRILDAAARRAGGRVTATGRRRSCRRGWRRTRLPGKALVADRGPDAARALPVAPAALGACRSSSRPRPWRRRRACGEARR